VLLDGVLVLQNKAMARWLLLLGVISLGPMPACGGEVSGNELRSKSGTGGTDHASALGSGGVAIAVGGRGNAASTGSNGTGGADVCADITASTTIAIQPVVEFLVDTGSSMADSDVPSTHGQTKWAATREVLRQTFAALPTKWAVGVAYFNLPTDQSVYQGAQAVPIAPLTAGQIAAIDASLDAVVPKGLTPTLAAWRYGLAQALSWTSSAREFQASPRHIVLVTDSVPTVNGDGATPGSGMSGTITEVEYDDQIQAIAAEIELVYVKTFVAGVPGSEDPEGAPYDPLYQLSRLAAAGETELPGCTPAPGTVIDCYDAANQRPSTCLGVRGSYCHIDLTTTSDLGTPLLNALNQITTPISCAFVVPPISDGRAIDPNGVTITFTPFDEPPQTFTRSLDDCSTGDWYFSLFDANSEPTEIQLCPNRCQSFVQSEGVSVKFVFTCL
jgi:hypothetical protein